MNKVSRINIRLHIIYFAILPNMNQIIMSLWQVQQLVLDIQKIARNHHIPETGKSENVVDHSFSVSMLCWKLFSKLQPPLDLEKILKYCLAHDFLERGLEKDVNTYADEKTRAAKQQREAAELDRLEEEFSTFPDLVQTIKAYESMIDEEAKFVWVVDKMQAIILGEMDDWRPYRMIAVSYAEFTAKGEEIMQRCPEILKPTLKELNDYSRQVFYDQP